MVNVEQLDLRSEVVDRVVRDFALQEFKLKTIVSVVPTSAWKNTYWRENRTELTGGTGSAFTGVPRLANFPYAEVTWTEATARLIKFGDEGVVSYEDEKTSEIDVVARTLLRISRGVANAVDTHIWNTLTEDQTATNINGVTIAAGSEWDSATLVNRDPLRNILNGIRLIQEFQYDTSQGLYLLVNPKDYQNLMAHEDVKKVADFWTDDVTRNGQVGRVVGATIVVSTVVTADYAAVCVGKQALTYKQAEDLKVEVINDPGIKKTIRAWEVGVAQLHDPKAVCLLTNTAA